MLGPRGQRGAVSIHLVANTALVGPALRVRAGRDARRRVGRLLLLHRSRRAAQLAILCAGRLARFRNLRHFNNMHIDCL